MQLRDLEFFIAVAEDRSFRKAATQSNVTQPAISKGIKRLENELGIKLLDRTRSGAELTEAGAAFLQRAKQLRLTLDEALREASNIRSRYGALLRVGVAPSLITTFFHPSSEVLIAQRPAARFHLTIALSDQLFSNLRRGDLDLVISTIPNPLSKEFSVTNIGCSPLRVVASRTHPLLSRRRVRLEDLGKYQWILPRRGVVARDWLDRIFVSNALPLPVARVEMDTQTDLMLPLTARSDLLTISAGASEADLSRSGLSAFPIAALSWERPVGALKRAELPISPLLADYLEVLQSTEANRRQAAHRCAADNSP